VVKLLALVAAIAGAGCLKNAAFSCEQDVDCARAGETGVCESTGSCSFVDPACPGGRRYGELSGALANQCVGGGTPDDATQPDMPVTGDDAGMDMVITAPFCDSAGEPTLVGCWEFEGNLNDGSGDNNNGTAANANVTFVAGMVGMAMQQDGTARVTVADSASLSPAAITIEAWIAPSITSAVRMGIIDNQNSYGFFIRPSATPGLQCTTATVTATIPLNVFTHVACTYDQVAGSQIYVDGTAIAPAGAGGTPLGAGTADGAVIGGDSPGPADALVGRIDQMRIWNVARTADEICRAAGRTPPCT
jgi:hypothetical protein